MVSISFMISETVEQDRLSALQRYKILDTPKEEIFDRICSLLARLLDVSCACVTLVDKDRVWFKAAHGISAQEVPREPGLCTTAITSDEILYLPDASVDERSKDNPLVTAEQGIRFYVGAPLCTTDGHRIGTLCAFDKKMRKLTKRELDCISDLAALVMHEIEERRRRRELERTEAALRNSQRLESVGMVASGVAHDFNNLLGGILGNTGLLRQEVGNPVLAVDLLNEIEFITRRAADLAGQVLAYAGKDDEELAVPIDVNRVVRETGYMLDAALCKQTELELDLSDEPMVTRTNRTALQQLIMNLITNASESYGGAPGRVRLSTRCDAQTNEVLVKVSDDGSGMAPETRDRIFDPFFTTKKDGKGLGLAVVQRILARSGGSAAVNSAPQQGTSIEIRLPSSVEEVLPAQRHEVSNLEWRGEGTILMIDDEEPMLKMTSRILNNAGFDVFAAPDGQQALELFEKHGNGLSAIILDLTMPKMNGPETLRALRRLAKGELKTPVILSSGHTEREATSQFDDPSIGGFLQKPYSIDELLTIVRQVTS